MLRTKLLTLVTLLMFAVGAQASTTSAPVVVPEPAEVLKMLMKGNKEFVKGDTKNLDKMSDPATRKLVAAGQHPYAIIVTCSDSRLPPEILFDKGLGEIFVVRVAGNVVSPHELGSIEYAAEHLGVKLVMVLGHERCGAVTAAVDTVGHVEGNIGSLIDDIHPAVEKVLAAGTAATHDELVDQSIDANIDLVAERIVEQSPVVEEKIKAGELKIVRAKYDLDTGKVRLFE